jgi:uncharacterized protein YkuJ
MALLDGFERLLEAVKQQVRSFRRNGVKLSEVKVSQTPVPVNVPQPDFYS